MGWLPKSGQVALKLRTGGSATPDYSTDWSKRGKRLEKYVRVAIAIELVTVGTKLEDL